MNCREAQKYIYLNREFGEEIENNVSFEKHIKSCPECHQRYIETQRYFAAAAKIQNVNFYDEFLESASLEIIRKVRNIDQGKTKIKSHNIINVFYSAPFRFVAASIILFFVTFYFFEEFTATRNIHALENKYDVIAEKELNKTNLVAAPNILKSASSLYSFFNGRNKYLELPGEWMLIKKSEIIKLMEEYKKYSAQDLSSTDYMKHIKNILGEDNFKKLVNEKANINKLFDRAFPAGELIK